VFHVKHTRRTRHTHPAQPSASMLPHFAQLPPGAAPHSKRGAHAVAVGPTPKPQHPTPSTPSTQPHRRRPRAHNPQHCNPKHPNTYALSAFPHYLTAPTWQN